MIPPTARLARTEIVATMPPRKMNPGIVSGGSGLVTTACGPVHVPILVETPESSAHLSSHGSPYPGDLRV
jgi:hypothetical protein